MSPEITTQLALATGQTLYMVGIAALIATLFGLPLGVFLATSRRDEIFAAPIANRLIGAIVNATRSTPFIILVVAIIPLTRLIAHAEAVLQDGSKANEWVEYETRLNDVLPRYDDPVICTYDANLLNGTIAVDILRTHPVAIIGGRLYENPFFAPPAEFLPQIIERSGKSSKPYRSAT